MIGSARVVQNPGTFVEGYGVMLAEGLGALELRCEYERGGSRFHGGHMRVAEPQLEDLLAVVVSCSRASSPTLRERLLRALREAA